MDRRKFLRDGSLFSLALAMGKGIASAIDVSPDPCAPTCKDIVSIVLHGFMFYHFTQDSGKDILQIIAPKVDDHSYFRGQVKNKDGSRLERIDATTSFPTQGLSLSGTANSFPSEVPRFSRGPQLGQLIKDGHQLLINLPLPLQILPLSPHDAPEFSQGKVKVEHHTQVAGSVCLQYVRSGELAPWLGNGKVNIYAQQPSVSGKCTPDHNGAHLNKALQASKIHFEHRDNFDLTAQCKGRHCVPRPPAPPSVCNLCIDDLYDLCELSKVPGVSSAATKQGSSGDPPTTTAGPLCVGFFVTP